VFVRKENVNTVLSRRIEHGTRSVFIDPEVKKSKVKVIWLSSVLSVWVCMLI